MVNRPGCFYFRNITSAALGIITAEKTSLFTPGCLFHELTYTNRSTSNEIYRPKKNRYLTPPREIAK